MTLVGEGSDVTVLDGEGLDKIFYLDTTGLPADSNADITIQKISLQNGNSISSGGGLQAFTNEADFQIENCDFEFNKTKVSVGAGVTGLGGGGDGIGANIGGGGGCSLMEGSNRASFPPYIGTSNIISAEPMAYLEKVERPPRGISGI